MNRGLQGAMSYIGSSIVTLVGVAIVLCGVFIVLGALLLAISPTTFISLTMYLPEAMQERLAMDALAIVWMGDLGLSILCAIGAGAFLAWLGHKIVTR